MKKQIITAAILAGLSSLSMAETVASINGTKIDSKEIDAQVARVKKDSNGQIQDSQQLRMAILDRMVTRILLVQAAQKDNLDKSPEYQSALDKAMTEIKSHGDDKKAGFKTEWNTYKDIVLGKLYLSKALQANPVQESEIKQSYDAMTQYYKGTQEVQLGEIVTNDLASANNAIKDLNNKQDFGSVVAKYTIDQAGREIGGIPKDYVALKDLQNSGAEPVYNAIKDLKKGQYTTTPVQGNNFYAVFYINDKRNVKIPSYQEEQPRLAEYLKEARIQQIIHQLYEQAKKNK